jgi:hypothetical protein
MCDEAEYLDENILEAGKFKRRKKIAVHKKITWGGGMNFRRKRHDDSNSAHNNKKNAHALSAKTSREL